ncbi:trypsin-like peptidase domain-containing protein [candidate division KSB1 bacterium]|nr:trypsin-like peptidase domain-containing protein [candidate division KSB1 bacterium]
MNKIIITPYDIAETETSPIEILPKTQFMPLWWRFLTGLLILVPPLLFGATIVSLVINRRKELAIRYSTTFHLCCLLLTSGFLWMLIGLALLFRAPNRTQISEDADSPITFSNLPLLPSIDALSGKEIVQKLSPLVVAIRKAESGTAGNRAQASGAGVTVLVNETGCLILTSRHVIDEFSRNYNMDQVINITMQDGQHAVSNVVGIHQILDLALLWTRSEPATAEFIQPIRDYSSIEIGEQVYVIGHPEGLEFSISNGLISQKRDDERIQISAPVSPGNSGGPVYDNRGRLAGIVQCVLDKRKRPNAENLNFAISADALLTSNNWILNPKGRDEISDLFLRFKNKN